MDGLAEAIIAAVSRGPRPLTARQRAELARSNAAFEAAGAGAARTAYLGARTRKARLAAWAEWKAAQTRADAVLKAGRTG